jgi:hypothetical protein
LFPEEPILPSGTITIGEITQLSAKSVGALLGAIAVVNPTIVVIVVHALLASESGPAVGVSLPLTSQAKIKLDGAALDLLLDPKADPPKGFELSVEVLNQLRAKARLVQDLRLERVEFRACRIGDQSTLMDKLRQLFGATTIGAAAADEFWAALDTGKPGFGQKAYENFKKKHPKHTLEGEQPNRFAWALKWDAKKREVVGGVLAESQAGRDAWLEGHLGKLKVKDRRWFPLHAQISGTDLFFPLDAGYRANLRTRP